MEGGMKVKESSVYLFLSCWVQSFFPFALSAKLCLFISSDYPLLLLCVVRGKETLVPAASTLEFSPQASSGAGTRSEEKFKAVLLPSHVRRPLFCLFFDLIVRDAFVQLVIINIRVVTGQSGCLELTKGLLYRE